MRADEVMSSSRHFSFETLTFEPVAAHDGVGRIGFTRVVEEGAGGAYNFLDMSVVPPGSTIGEHTHADDNEELYIVIAGSGVMRLDGEEFPVGPGHVVINRPGGTHALRNTGAADLLLVVIEVRVRE